MSESRTRWSALRTGWSASRPGWSASRPGCKALGLNSDDHEEVAMYTWASAWELMMTMFANIPQGQGKGAVHTTQKVMITRGWTQWAPKK